MSTQSQIDANRINATKSTGPASSEGKSASSKNSLVSGLFTAHDFVLPEEAPLYKDFFDAMFQELSPAGLVENTLANQIASAAWRLRRCDLADSGVAGHSPLEPLLDSNLEKQIRSIERARASAHGLFNRSINQLRKLQTERVNRAEIDWAKCNFPQLADTAKTQKALTEQYRLDKEMRDLQKYAASVEAAQVEQAMQAIMNAQPAQNTASTAQLASFCKTPSPAPAAASPRPPATLNFPRNAPCPCKSGRKFKQCCIGKAA